VENAAEYQRLYAEFVDAVARAGTILKARGMDSEEFRQADADAGRLSVRLRELRGDAGKNWMA
jgi:hypothetical protein